LSRALVAIYGLTGATALAYQLVWSRVLAREFGATLVTTSAVVACYLIGLAGGGLLFGGTADRMRRPLLLFATLEAGVGVYAALSPQLLTVVTSRALIPTAGSFRLFLVTALFLLPPTLLMGGSFPAVLAAARADAARHRRPALLYGANTAGAVLGVLAAAFVLIPGVGLAASLRIAAAANLIAAAIALTLALRWPARDVGPASSAVVTRRGLEPRARLAIGAIALSGCAALLGEVAWTRGLALAIGSSVYAFALVLAAFLLGIGIGSFAYANRPPSEDALVSLTHYQLRAATAGALFAIILTASPRFLTWAIGASSGDAAPMAGAAFLVAFVATAYATTALGASFPAAMAELMKTAAPGRASARAYAFNTLGAVIGAIAAAVLLIPSIGLAATLAVGVCLSLMGAVVASGFERRLMWRAAAGGLIALTVIPAWWRWNQEELVSGVYAYAYDYSGEASVTASPAIALPERPPFRSPAGSLIYVRDGAHANVAVHRDEYGELALLIDGKADASTALWRDMRTQLLLGHLPALLHTGQPRQGLVIGLGSGVTLSALLRHPTITAVDAVEIEPVVAHVASTFFAAANGAALEDVRTRLVIGDGRRWVGSGTSRYDIITSEPSNLWMAGVSHLFTAEFFAEAAAALRADGVLCQWMHLYQVSPTDVRVVLRGLLDSFPNADAYADGPDLLIVASRSPLRAAEHALASPAVIKDLDRVAVNSPGHLRRLLLADRVTLARFAGDGIRHTDDRPILEFSAPLSLARDRSAEIVERIRAGEGPR